MWYNMTMPGPGIVVTQGLSTCADVHWHNVIEWFHIDKLTFEFSHENRLHLGEVWKGNEQL